MADLIRVYRGDVPLRRALSDGLVEAIGDYQALEALPVWLNLGVLATIRPVARAAAATA